MAYNFSRRTPPAPARPSGEELSHRAVWVVAFLGLATSLTEPQFLRPKYGSITPFGQGLRSLPRPVASEGDSGQIAALIC